MTITNWQSDINNLLSIIPYGIGKLDLNSIEICGSVDGFGIKNLYSNLNSISPNDMQLSILLQENSKISRLSTECGMFTALLHKILEHNNFHIDYNLKFQKVMGQEPQFFNSEGSRHAYLLITDTRDNTQYLACPISKKIIEFENSGYTILDSFDDPFRSYQTTVLDENDSFLMIENHLILSLLQENEDSPPVIIIGDKKNLILEAVSVMKPVSEIGLTLPPKILDLCNLIKAASLNEKHSQRSYLDLFKIHQSEQIVF
jgi:hypothetical protein